jgi:hypothetical protein
MNRGFVSILAGSGAMLIGIACATVLWRSGPDSKTSRLQASAEIQAKESVPSAPPKSPPWGELECVPFSLELPEEYLVTPSGAAGDPIWFFPGYSTEKLTAFFGSCGLEDAQRASLTDRARWRVVANGCYVSPPSKVVLELNPAARERIHSVLASGDFNVTHYFAFRLRLDDFEKHFLRAGLPPAKFEVLKRLAYTNENMVCLADLEVLSSVFTVEEMRTVKKGVLSSSCVLLQLRVTPNTDIASLVNYWGKGGRTRAVKPLLESLALIPGGASIGVGLLLPPFARQHLYVYPDPALHPQETREDCVWTALNFFNDPPDDKLLDTEQSSRKLREDYVVVKDTPVYGDLVVLVDSATGRLVHASVYIADDVVFTKNGMDPMQPWVFMKIPDMVVTVSALSRVRAATLRHKAVQS